MSIGWYPGHMVAARKKATEAMAQIDVVVEVLDARLPGASGNPIISEMRAHRQRPCLKILNKADVADPAVTAAWVKAIETEYGAKAGHQGAVKAVALSCKKASDVARVLRLAASLVPHRDSHMKAVRMLVMGVPNVGKSTLINALLKRRVAPVGDEPAITKQLRRYELDDRTVLFDTPGLMWPAITHPSDGLMLAASHAIGANAYIDEEVATYLAELLLQRYPALLAKRYGCTVAGLDGPALIEAVAKQRGLRARGGVLDLEKAAHVLLTDYRQGAIGRISLETPQSRAAMLATLAVAPAAQAESRVPAAPASAPEVQAAASEESAPERGEPS